MTNQIIKYRWVIIIVCLLMGAGFSVLIPSGKTDPEIRNYVPQNMPSRIATSNIEKEFGVQDMVVIIFSDSLIISEKNLKQIRDIDYGIARLGGITTRMSPFTIKSIKSEAGMMTADPLISKIPGDPDEIKQLVKSIDQNSFAKDVVFSHDLTAASITATINNDKSENTTLHQIDSVIAANPGSAKILKGGLPYIRQSIMKDVRKDAVFLVPAALLVMLLILKLTLGDWKSVFVPFTVVVLSTGISMGLIPLFGWKISILSLLIPIIIVAVANNYGIYLVARKQEILQSWDGSSQDLLQKLTGSLNMPILFSGLTTIAGILGLLTHSIIPARQVGILAAAGVTIALLMSLTFIPALIYVSRSDIRKKTKTKFRNGFFERTLSRLSGIIVSYPKRILIISVIITLVVSLGAFFLRIETNQENYFPKNHPVRLASEAINSKFGGSQTISVQIEGDIKDPAIMKKIDNMTIQLEKTKGVGKVFSISQVVREMSKAVFTKDEKEYNTIPETRDAIAQLFELYNMSGDQGDFKQLMNPDNTKAHVLIRLSDPENNVIRAVKEKIGPLLANIPVKITIGGYAIIMADFAGSVIKGQGSSLIFAIVTVFLLLAIIFKSFKGGLVGSIPLVASIFILFGFMGLTGIALDSATALLSSIMIGVGVDFTIQYMWCFNLELRKGKTYENATITSLSTIGRSIIINALSVMAGFSVLVMSGFTSIRFFGYLVFISIGSCLIGAIVIIPAYLICFKPRFIEKDLSNKKNRIYEKNNSLIGVDTAAF
jgi:uncharacterized protein